MDKGIFSYRVFRRRSAACRLVASVSAFALACVASLPAFAATQVLDNGLGGASFNYAKGATHELIDADHVKFTATQPGGGLIDWQALNVGSGQRIDFQGSQFFNVVSGGAKSQIAGELSASGALWIFNPAGVSFLAGSKTTVGGLFSVATAKLANQAEIEDAIEAGLALDSIPAPQLGNLLSDGKTGDGQMGDGSITSAKTAEFHAGRVAFAGRKVKAAGDFSGVGQLSVGAADRLSVVDDVAGGKVRISIADFTDDTDVLGGVGVELGDITPGDSGRVGDVSVVSEGSIAVKGAVKADGEIVFETLAADGASAEVISCKKMSVASGKLLQGKSVSATAAGHLSVGGDIEATDGDVTVETGLFTDVKGSVAASGGVSVAAKGNVNVLGSVVAAQGDVVLSATGEGKSVKVGSSDVAASVAATQGSVTLDGAKSAQVQNGSSVTAGGDATLTGGEYVLVDEGGSVSAASGKATLTAGRTDADGEYVGILGEVSAKDVEVVAYTGDKLSKAPSVTAFKDLAAGDAAGVYVSGGSVSAADSVSVTAKGGSVLVSEEGSLSVGDDGSMALDGTQGIDVQGAVTAKGAGATLSLTSENGSASLSSADNEIGGTVDVAASSVDVNGDANDFAYGSLQAGADGNLTIHGNAKDVSLTQDVSVSGEFKIVDAADISLGSDVLADTASLSASGTVEQSADRKFEANDGIELVADGGATLKGAVDADKDGDGAGDLVVGTSGGDGGVLVQDGGTIKADRLSAEKFVQKNGGTLNANVVEADVEQKGCTIADNGDGTITVIGDVTQEKGLIGGSSVAKVTIEGDLAQNAVSGDADTAVVQATEIVLAGAASQGGELAGDAIKATTLTLDASGKDVSLMSGANAFGTVEGEAKDVAVATSGALVIGGVKSESLTVKAGGAVTQTDPSEVSGLVDVTAITAGGNLQNVMLLAPDNKFGSVKVKGDAIQIKESDDVVIAGIDGYSMVLVEAGPSGDPVSYSGAITQTGAIKAPSGARFYGSSVKLDDANNAIGMRFSARADAGDVEVVNGGYVKVDSVNVVASGAVKLTSKSSGIGLNSDASISGSSVELTAEGGSINLSGKVTVTSTGGAAVFTAANGSVTAENGDNDFQKVSAVAKSVSLKDKNGVDVAASGITATDGMAKIEAGGKVHVKGDVTGEEVSIVAGDFVNVADGKTVSATDGAVGIEAAGNVDVYGGVAAENGAVSLSATGEGKSVRVAGTVSGKTGATLAGDKSVQVGNGGSVASSGGDVTLTAKEFVSVDGGSVEAPAGTATLKTTVAELLTAGGPKAGYEAGQLAGVTVGKAAAGSVSAKDVVVESAGSVLVGSGSTVSASDGVTIAANGTEDATVATSGITKQGVYVVGATVQAGGDMAVSAAGNVMSDAASRIETSGDLSIVAGGADGIAAAGALVADADGKTATLSAANGAIDARGADNDFRSVEASAKGGVALNDKDDVVLADVEAASGDVTATAGGQITATKVYANGEGGKATLTAAEGDIVVDDVQAAAKIAATASAGAIEESGSDAAADLSAPELDLDAATGIGAAASLETSATTIAADTTEGRIDIDNSNAAATTASSLTTGAGGVYFSQTGGGALTVTKAASGTGNVEIDVSGADLSVGEATAGGTVKLVAETSGDVTVAENGVVRSGNGDVLIESAGGNVTIKNAVVEAGGLVGEEYVGNLRIGGLSTDDGKGVVTVDAGASVSAGRNVTVEAGKSVALKSDVTASAGDAVVVAGNGAVSMDAGTTLSAGGNAVVEATDGVALSRVVASATDGTASVRTTGGDIVDVNADAEPNATAKYVSLDAAAGSVGTGANHVDTSAGAVAATSKGGVFISEADGVEVGAVASVDAAVVNADGTAGTRATTQVSGLAASDGAVVLDAAAGDVTVSQQVSASGDGGNVLVAANGEGGSVTVGAAVSAGKNATVAAAKDVAVNADVTATGGDAVLVAAEGAVSMADGTMVSAASGNIAIDGKAGVGIAKAEADGTVYARSSDGDVTGSSAGVVPNVTAKNAAFDAGSGSVGSASSPMRTFVDTVAANSGKGVYVSEAIGLEVGTVDAVSVAEVSSDGTASGTYDTASLSGLAATANGPVVVRTESGDLSVKQAISANGAGGNVLAAANGHGASIVVDADVSASRSATVTADKNVTLNADVTAGKDAYVESTAGNVKMKDGKSVTAGEDAFVGAKGKLQIAKVKAGNGIWLKTQTESVVNESAYGVDGVNVEAQHLRIESGEGIGESSNPLKTNVVGVEARAESGSVYIDEKDSLKVEAKQFAVDKVGISGAAAEVDSGNLNGISASDDVSVAAGGSISVDEGIVAGDDVSVAAGGGVTVNDGIVAGDAVSVKSKSGSVTVNSLVSGETVDVSAKKQIRVNGAIGSRRQTVVTSASDVSFGAAGQVSGSAVALTAGGSITQDDATITSPEGFVDGVQVNAAVSASGKATLKAGDSIGSVSDSSISYVGVEAGSVAASAKKSVAVADPNGDGLVVDADGIKADGKVAVYTSGSVTGSGKISAQSVTVSAKSYEEGSVKVSVGNSLAANNFVNGMSPLLAIFDSIGGSSRPNFDNRPNKTIAFFDGRLLGGDLKAINTLGAIEAFPVQTPELKSEQGIFGNPTFLHDELDVANPLAVGAIDFILQEIPRLRLSDDFPIEVEEQLLANGLNPTTSYWFGQDRCEEEK